MKCPLLVLACLTSKEAYNQFTPECPKENCAWWDNERNVCEIVSLSYNIQHLYEVLQDIREKMPPPGK